MLRKIAFGTGAVMAALGLALSVPGAAMAAPSTEAAAAVGAGDITIKRWVEVDKYSSSMTGAAACNADAVRLHRETGHSFRCYNRGDYISLQQYFSD